MTGIENILEAIMQHNAQQQVYMARMVDGTSQQPSVTGCNTDDIMIEMRTEADRRHQETLEMVQATAHERIDFNLNHVSILILAHLKLLANFGGFLVYERLQQGSSIRSAPASPRSRLSL